MIFPRYFPIIPHYSPLLPICSPLFPIIPHSMDPLPTPLHMKRLCLSNTGVGSINLVLWILAVWFGPILCHVCCLVFEVHDVHTLYSSSSFAPRPPNLNFSNELAFKPSRSEQVVVCVVCFGAIL